MDTVTATRGADDPPAAVRAAEHWADFTKALSIYPETNERVRAHLDSLRAALDEAHDEAHGAEPGASNRPRGLPILLRVDSVVVAGRTHETNGASSMPWLRARLERAGLAGVELARDLDEDALVAFTRRLLTNYLRTEPGLDFEELWPETYEGIVLIDRRFEGSFGGGGGGGGGPAAAGAGHAGSGGGVDRRTFLRALLADPEVRKRVTALHDLGEAVSEEGEETSAVRDMLQTIVDDLSVEDLESSERLVGSVCRVLDHAVGAGEGGTSDPDSGRFAALLHRVSRQHFARRGPALKRRPDEELGTPPGGERARDAAITDDVSSLLAEIDALPAEPQPTLSATTDAAQSEQVAVLLHFLLHAEDPHELPGLGPTLTALLEQPAPAVFGLLRAHYERTHEGGNGAGERARLVEYLADTGGGYLLRACGALGPDDVVASFPQGFGMWLDALDMGRRRDRVELDEVCERIGAERILEATEDLERPIGRLSGEQASSLFRHPDARRLALVRQLLALHPEPRVIEGAVFVRALDLPEDEAFLLFRIDDLALLSREYLVGLIDLHLGRAEAAALRTAVSEILCRHIEALATCDPCSPERMESIRSLVRFPSARSQRMLRDLSRGAFGPFGGKEPGSVRRLARSVARDHAAA